MLLKLTRDYYDYERPELVKKGKALAKKKGARYIEPNQVFLNVLNGKAVSAKTLQNEFCTACKKVGMKTAGHGLRAYFAMRVVTDLYLGLLENAGGDVIKVDVNTVILFAKEELGHSSMSTTIGHYVDIVKLRMLAMTPADRQAYYNGRKEIIERELAHAERKLKNTAEGLTKIDGLAEAIDRGDKDKVWELIKNLDIKKMQKLSCT